MVKIVDEHRFSRIADEARQGRVSRRDFMAFTVAAGLTATTASGLWTSTAHATPMRGGNFRFGIHDGNTMDTHDPGTYVTRQMVYLAHQYRSYLTLIESDGSLGPDLATEWTANEDGTAWTFKLHPKASFHSGKKVTANDVVASMNHHRGEDSTSTAKALLTTVAEIVANGDDVVVFKLRSPNVDLPWLMTDYRLAICPANADGSLNWQSGDGSGPYRIDQGEFGVQWTLSRHEGWHLEGAYFDTLEMLVLNDPNARQTALITGDVDAVSSVELKTLALLDQNPDIKVESVPSAATITMPMHCDRAPFDNRDVRNALKYAIDRAEIVEKIAAGHATVGNDFHLSPVQPYWPDDIPQHEYDPDRARSLLKKAGMADLSIDISVADSLYPGAVDTCLLYQAHAKKAGIHLNVVREPSDGYYSNVWLKKPFCVASWGARPTPDVIFTEGYQTGSDWNESRWQNERFNELLFQAKGELDEGLRAEMYREMCMLAHDDGGTVIPMFLNLVYARRANVMHGDKLAPNWELDGARGPSRWWFAG